MGVSLDYVYTRAVGIKRHFLNPEDYHRLISYSNVSEVIEELRSFGYNTQLSRYYTTLDPILSFTRAIFEEVGDRYKKILGWAQTDLIKKFDIYRDLIDFKNLISLLMFQPENQGKLKQPIFYTKLTPGGFIKFQIWVELFSEPNHTSIRTKSLIFAPQLYDFLDQIKDITDFASFEFYKVIMNHINETTINEHWTHQYRVTSEPANLMLLDVVNKLLVRLLQQKMELKETDLGHLKQLLEPWSKINWLVKEEDLKKGQNYMEFQQRVLSKLEVIYLKYQHILDSKLDFVDLNWEKIVGFMTTKVLKSRSRAGEYEFSVMLILYQIPNEARNLVWLIFGKTHHLDQDLLRRGLIN